MHRAAGQGDVLLIDTCGENAAVAIAREGVIAATVLLPQRTASAQLVGAVRDLLARCSCRAADLGGIGVVSGPGSFTGVRVGLAAAKGLCEAWRVPLGVMSRLAVLASAAGNPEAFAVLDAGRGQYFVRTPDGAEQLMTPVELAEVAGGKRVLVAEARAAEELHSLAPQLHVLTMADVLPLVLEQLAAGGSDTALTDANYVRGEADIYARTATP